MSPFVENIRRLFKDHKITLAQIKALYPQKISVDEFNYIISGKKVGD